MGMPLEWFLEILFIFVVSFASNVTPFVGASYTLLGALNLVVFGFTPFSFVLVVVVTASGATLAKVAIYYGSFGLRRFLLQNQNVRLIGRLANRRNFYVGLFMAAVMPVFPFDDFLFIGAGANSATLKPMTLVTFTAKFVKSAVEIPLEYSLLNTLTTEFGVGSTATTVVIALVFLAIGIAIYKVDWEKAFPRLRQRSGSGDTSGGTMGN